MSGEGLLYLDSSATVKLLIDEAESDALKRFAAPYPGWTTCALARAEVPRAARRHGLRAVARAATLLEEPSIIALDHVLLDTAAALAPPSLRTLDAIHLAAALSLGDDLDALITYDHRMAEAAQDHGIPVEAPA